MIGHVCALELGGRDREHPRDVHRDVAVPDHDRPLAAQIELALAVVGVAVVPGDELGRGDASGEILARDPHPLVGLGTDRVDDRVVAGRQVLVRDVAAQLDVPEEAKAGASSGLLEHARHGLDVRVIGRHAAAHEPPRSRQPVEYVDLDDEVRTSLGAQQLARRVEPGRSRADDRDAQGAGFGADRSHGESA